MCEAALQAGVKKLIHFSSVDAFYRFPVEEPLLESRKLIDDPNAVPYDLSKADGQKIVLEFCEKEQDEINRYLKACERYTPFNKEYKI